MNKVQMLSWLKEGNVTLPVFLFKHYKEMKLTEQELVFIIEVIVFMQEGNEFPTPEELSGRMTLSGADCTNTLRRLMQKGLIAIIDGISAEGIRFEKYSLEPFWTKLVDQFVLTQQQVEINKTSTSEVDLYSCFETEFGRPLSPFECETLSLWMDDHHDPLIIKAALREAVLSGKLNFRYIDRILFEWKKNGIKTIEQAKSHGQKFRQKQTQTKANVEARRSPTKTVQFYNWLEQ